MAIDGHFGQENITNELLTLHSVFQTKQLFQAVCFLTPIQQMRTLEAKTLEHLATLADKVVHTCTRQCLLDLFNCIFEVE